MPRILYLGMHNDDLPILARYTRQGPDVSVSFLVVDPGIEDLTPLGRADVLVMTPALPEALRMRIADAVLATG